MEKQLNFFTNTNKNEKEIQPINLWAAFIDGASRNNPGPAGAGVFIKKDDVIFLKKGFFLGYKTNNQAEYLALALALFFIKNEKSVNPNISIVSDSELLIKQMNGFYQIKNQELIKIKNLIDYLLQNTKTTFKHVLREQNKIADKLANEGIDKKHEIPADFVILMKNFDIK
ncbi:ribonuclease HI family protein [Candidatus Dependentiae bacterium]|nr:ribonuclease HI family protein [Candidatus Dependentiae bacterium]MBU4387727.1 ribonuclease HI family protein [Candidatus Dependentiae bacterium]MCG2755984.1 ribonuclease HI family protein [Candidatus Dependentiae bacterium]